MYYTFYTFSSFLYYTFYTFFSLFVLYVLYVFFGIPCVRTQPIEASCCVRTQLLHKDLQWKIHHFTTWPSQKQWNLISEIPRCYNFCPITFFLAFSIFTFSSILLRLFFVFFHSHAVFLIFSSNFSSAFYQIDAFCNHFLHLWCMPQLLFLLLTMCLFFFLFSFFCFLFSFFLSFFLSLPLQ